MQQRIYIKLMKYTISSYGASDQGYVRDNNEDAWAQDLEANFFVVADGMGGHQAGEIASGEAVRVMVEQVKKIHQAHSDLSFEEVQGIFYYAIEEANRHVYQLSRSRDDYRGMGTTLCCLYFHKDGVVYGHVGDSRIYRYRRGELEQLTDDHSLYTELQAGGKQEVEIREMGIKNMITRAVGTALFVEPSIHMGDVELGDIYFMCTDGVTDLLSDSDMAEYLGESKSISEAAKKFIDIAKKRGGYDNITVLMVQVQ